MWSMLGFAFGFFVLAPLYQKWSWRRYARKMAPVWKTQAEEAVRRADEDFRRYVEANTVKLT